MATKSRPRKADAAVANEVDPSGTDLVAANGRHLLCDHSMHLADLSACGQAQSRVGELYGRPDDWARMALVNVACLGKFSSDRTIADYAAET